jgi:drug/metabolite transporter (DMT)-like permease
MNLLLLALVPACFALNPVIGRAMSGAFGPASLSVTRWALSGLIIAAVAVSRGGAERWHAPAGLYGRLIVLGALGMGFCAYAAFAAARTTEATSIGLIYACTTPLVASFEMVAGRQRADWALLAGIGACLGGVVIILTRGHPETLFNLAFTAGDLWAAAGMVVFAGYTVALRRTPTALTPMAQFAVMSIGDAGVAAVVPRSLLGAGFADLAATLRGWRSRCSWPGSAFSRLHAFVDAQRAGIDGGVDQPDAHLRVAGDLADRRAARLAYHGRALALVVGGLLLINRGQGSDDRRPNARQRVTPGRTMPTAGPRGAGLSSARDDRSGLLQPQQTDVAAGGGDVGGAYAFGGEAGEVVRAAGLRPGA